VLKETGRGKSPRKVKDLLADGRCSRAVLDFRSTTDVARLVPAEGDAGSEVSEWEPRERREPGEERSAEAEELGAGEGIECQGGAAAVPTHALLDGIRRR